MASLTKLFLCIKWKPEVSLDSRISSTYPRGSFLAFYLAICNANAEESFAPFVETERVFVCAST